MATTKTRSKAKRRKLVRRRGPELAGIKALLERQRPETRLNRELFERENEFAATRPPLSAAAIRERKAWDREGLSVARSFLDHVHDWDRTAHPILPDFHIPPRELLHVFGPDTAGTGESRFYTLEWTHRDPYAGVGSFAQADRRKGRLIASHYTTSNWLSAYAGVGMRLEPKVGAGILSVRPFVNWSGHALLQHRTFDPRLGEQRWGVAQGSVGIIVQSTTLSGADFRTSPPLWVVAWRRAELNPQSASDHDGILSSSSLMLEVPIVSTRRYSIWIVCKASAYADPGFAVATRSSASMECTVPFVVAQEIPA